VASGWHQPGAGMSGRVAGASDIEEAESSQAGQCWGLTECLPGESEASLSGGRWRWAKGV
jgi:hypothetical protein